MPPRIHPLARNRVRSPSLPLQPSSFLHLRPRPSFPAPPLLVSSTRSHQRYISPSRSAEYNSALGKQWHEREIIPGSGSALQVEARAEQRRWISSGTATARRDTEEDEEEEKTDVEGQYQGQMGNGSPASVPTADSHPNPSNPLQTSFSSLSHRLSLLRRATSTATPTTQTSSPFPHALLPQSSPPRIDHAVSHNPLRILAIGEGEEDGESAGMRMGSVRDHNAEANEKEEEGEGEGQGDGLLKKRKGKRPKPEKEKKKEQPQNPLGPKADLPRSAATTTSASMNRSGAGTSRGNHNSGTGSATPDQADDPVDLKSKSRPKSKLKPGSKLEEKEDERKVYYSDRRVRDAVLAWRGALRLSSSMGREGREAKARAIRPLDAVFDNQAPPKTVIDRNVEQAVTSDLQGTGAQGEANGRLERSLARLMALGVDDEVRAFWGRIWDELEDGGMVGEERERGGAEPRGRMGLEEDEGKRIERIVALIREYCLPTHNNPPLPLPPWLLTHLLSLPNPPFTPSTPLLPLIHLTLDLIAANRYTAQEQGVILGEGMLRVGRRGMRGVMRVLEGWGRWVVVGVGKKEEVNTNEGGEESAVGLMLGKREWRKLNRKKRREAKHPPIEATTEPLRALRTGTFLPLLRSLRTLILSRTKPQSHLFPTISDNTILTARGIVSRWVEHISRCGDGSMGGMTEGCVKVLGTAGMLDVRGRRHLLRCLRQRRDVWVKSVEGRREVETGGGEWRRLGSREAWRRGEMTLGMKKAFFYSALRDEDYVMGEKMYRELKRYWGWDSRVGGEEKDKQVVDEVVAMTHFATASKNVQALAGLRRHVEAQHRLNQEDDGEIRHQAARIRAMVWASCVRTLGADSKLTNGDWRRFVRTIPRDLLSRKVQSMVVDQCLLRGMQDTAREYWAEWDDRLRGDMAWLTLRARVLLAREDAEGALAFLDQHVRRYDLGEVGRDKNKPKMDTVAVNVLIEGCNNLRRPDLASWLWNNMESRWKVSPDDITLAALIRCIDHAATQISMGKKASGMSDEFGLAMSWQEVGYLFRSIAMGLYPGLKEVQNPMDEGRVSSALGELVTSGHLPYSERRGSGPATAIVERFESVPMPARVEYEGIGLSASCFYAYIKLLLHRHLHSEAVLVLGWMRYLNINPSRNTITAVLSYLVESGDQKDLRFMKNKTGWSRYALLAPDEWVRYWLGTWMKGSQIPSEGEVAEAVRARAIRRDHSRDA